MELSRPSRTALSAARHRAAHQILDAGAVLRDPLALLVLGESPEQVERDARAHPDRTPMRWFICARARLAEDVAHHAAQAGASQLIILGAGLDTFGYRNPHPALRVTELDHPATQHWKLARLHAAGIDESAVRYQPVDFERDDLGALLADLVDTRSPILFWWLGVTPYLTGAAVEATLSHIGGLPSAAVVFDHASPIRDVTGGRRRTLERRRYRVAALGEPWISEYRSRDIEALARRCGFEQACHVHERTVIECATGRPATDPTSPPHLVIAASGWPTALPGRAVIPPAR